MEFNISKNMADMKPSVIREILKQMSDPTLISFAGGNPAPDTFPTQKIIEFSDDILKNEAGSVLQYSVSEGTGKFRQTIKNFANRRKQEQLVREFDDILVLSGSQQALNFTAKILCNAGDTVAVESPAFLGAYNAFYSFGAKLAAVPMQTDGVNISELEKVFSSQNKPKFFYCVPNFQNPTGYTTSLEKRKAIYDLAVKYNVPILEDDPYGELRFSGERIQSIKSFDEKGIVIYTSSFSKIMCPGIRLAYLVCEKSLFKHMVIAKQVDDVHTNVWSQALCEKILTQTDMDEHLNSIKQVYGQKAEKMFEQLEQKCPEITFTKPTGGIFIWAQLPQNVNASEFAKKCLLNKLAVIPGSAFAANEQGVGNNIRLNFSTPSFEQIEKGCAIMSSALDEMM